MTDPGATDAFTRLVDIMARLRGPGGCPWDREQTHETLRPYVLEEAYEVIDAIEHGDPGALRDELGDLLLQVVFHAQLATEAGRFTVDDVARAIADKLVRRHPHVFADTQVRDAQEVMRNWTRIKAEERKARGADADPFAGVPASLPALLRGQQIGEKAHHVGLDWDAPAAVLDKVREEQAELEQAVADGDRSAIERELGDLLFTLTSVARHFHVSAELALQSAVARFLARARHADGAARSRGTSLAALSPAERDSLWDQAKAATARNDDVV
jgi:tetrapyrrole methylase family protein/MazG family protein